MSPAQILDETDYGDVDMERSSALKTVDGVAVALQRMGQKSIPTTQTYNGIPVLNCPIGGESQKFQN